ncbi:hypothetical protein RLOatenuis_5850 [Rickettsiales bacterium]|nr:hypothetical protein RLOatenuis_5850 [Rickettsiales bacterium]
MGITLQRGPKKTDLVDGWHRKWDVKTPPYINNIGFNTEDAIDSITRKFEEFAEGAVGILLCISFMRMSDYQDLQSKLVCYLNQDQKFHVRQVSVRGVL